MANEEITIRLNESNFVKAATGKLTKISPEIVPICIGKRCKLVNAERPVFVRRYLHSVICEYGYWVKEL